MHTLKLFTVALLASGISGAAVAAPVFTDMNSTTALGMANALLSAGSGITINSAAYSGAGNASGLFNNGNSSNIGIDQGIVLSSGYLSEMESSFSDNNGSAGNPMLEAYNGGLSTNNASTLTIEFTPTGNQMTFSYVFASREYPDYVNGDVNDVFAFLVNGENRALIPGTNTPVSINTINCGEADGSNPSNCNLFRDNRDGNLSDLDLGGFTMVFDIIANVNPGVVNTLVLSIADSGDSVFDSAVFLRGGSLTVCGGPNQPPCNPQEVSEPAMLGIAGMALLTVGGLRRSRRRA
ncbi:MAG TPA: choice-of-anchor L domain-containing protein [Pedomonas sp.]|uniref:choice-of-anchor L domain-containing protein n=1 Tax=Pedomonas sp. TaxID=2976421 RepID=UPI002F3E45B9